MNRSGGDSGAYLPIADYGLIGDCHSDYRYTWIRDESFGAHAL